MNLIILFESDFIDSEKKRARLAGRRKEHLLSVIRLAKGESARVGLLNGKSGTGTVGEITTDFVELDVTLDTDPPLPLPLTLILALPRPKALKRCLETVAAMGVKTLYLIQSWRVEKSYWTTPELDETSMRDHLLLGLEQGCDTVLPRVNIRNRFKPFVEDELPTLVRGTRAFVAHPYDAAPCPYGLKEKVTLAIGPEGGFIPYEIEMFKKQGFEPVTMGPRILRVEQAVPALLGRIF
jgi:16S rRNA (uracil1498-N3)-methyltransferase